MAYHANCKATYDENGNEHEGYYYRTKNSVRRNNKAKLPYSLLRENVSEVPLASV